MNMFQSKTKDIDAAFKKNQADAQKDFPEYQKGNRTGKFEPIPPSTYEVQLVEATIGLTKPKPDREQKMGATFVWKVLEGEQKGKRHWQWQNLETDVGRYYFELAIGLLTDGQRFPGNLDEAGQIMMDLVAAETRAIITIKDDEYKNTYIDELLSGGGEEESVSAASTPVEGLQVGHRVTFKDRNGKDYEGTVVKVKKNNATVDVDNVSKPQDIPLDRLSIVPPPVADDDVPEDPEDIPF